MFGLSRSLMRKGWALDRERDVDQRAILLGVDYSMRWTCTDSRQCR